MNDVQRNFATAGIVCALSAALIGGMAMRERVDERAAGLHASISLAPTLLASREPQAEIPEERYFYDLMVLLKREYVDPISSELPLAVGAVKGMVSSLNDEQSLYMAKPLYKAFSNAIEGSYEGIGVNAVLRRVGNGEPKPIRTSLDLLERVPVVRVTYVVPGGPAHKAGLRAGDEIERIDSRWVVNPEIASRYRKIDEKVKEKKLPESAKTEIQKELREKFKESMMPMRALEKIVTGDTGDLDLAWRRGGKVMEGKVSKALAKVEVNKASSDGAFRPAFVAGASEKLKAAAGSGKPLVLDLRGMTHGDFREARSCLAVLGPAGDYGRIADDAGESEPIKISQGATQPKSVRILVDRYTGGVAEAFALALKSKGLASLEGGPMAGNAAIIERTTLPDGSGYTLKVGTFKAGGNS